MIPNSSQVLLVGVSPISLLFAVSMAKAGLEVLVIDNKSSSLDYQENEVLIPPVDIDFLQTIGFEIDELNQKIDLKNIEKQALKLLANSLCSILWDTNIKNTEALPGKFTLALEQNNKLTTHHTSLVIYLKDLEQALPFTANLKNAISLTWKIQGYLNGVLSAKTLNLHYQEKDIIKNYFTKDDGTKSIFHKLYDRFFNIQKGNLSFRDSQINLHLSQYRKVNAGDLLANLTFYDEKLKQETSLYQWCKFGNYSLIMLGDLPAYSLNTYANWLKTNYKLAVFYLPYTERNAAIFDYFEVFNQEKKTLIVRPDRIIGFINDRIELEIIENYLNNVLFMFPNAQAFAPKLLKEG